MSLPIRTGVVILASIIDHACRVIIRYAEPIDSVLVAAETADVITSAQHVQISTSINAMVTACTAWQIVSKWKQGL